MRQMRHLVIMSAAAVTATLALTACGGSQGTADRADAPANSQAAQGAEQPDEQPDTELSVGDAFEYADGVRFTVTSIRELKPGPYDHVPDGATPFRITYTVENGSKNTLDLDQWSYNASGATNGGSAEPNAMDGHKLMTGRLQPGAKGEFNSDYSLAGESGRSVAFEVMRMDDAVDVLATPPTWTGDITER